MVWQKPVEKDNYQKCIGTLVVSSYFFVLRCAPCVSSFYGTDPGLAFWLKKRDLYIVVRYTSKYSLLIGQINQQTWLVQIPGEFFHTGILLNLLILG